MTQAATRMNSTQSFYFEELSEGMDAESSNVITDENIVLFSQISGDVNPIHLDDDYAATTAFKKRIAHGSMCASYISAILGNQLPGPGCIYVNQGLRFKAPVYIGDTVITRAVIKKRVPEKSFVEISTQCFVNDVLVLDGEATIKVPNQPEGVIS